jgi:PPE-repeat protein
MWAQDAAAMFGYAGDSAVATRLTPFSSPPVTTNPAGLPEQAAAVAQAAGMDGGGLVSAVPMALEGLAAPAPAASSSPSPFMVLSLLTTAVSIVASSASVLFNTIIGPITLTSIGVTSASLAQSQQKQQEKQQDQSSPPQSATATTVVGEATARMGNATTVGRLAVPASWQFAAPAQLVSTALRHAGLSAAAAATPLNPDTANGLGLAIAAMASAGLGGAAGSGLAARPRAEATSTASQYGKAMAATLGHPGATRDRNAGSDISDADHNSGETPAPETLTGLERDILALVRRYTASPGT